MTDPTDSTADTDSQGDSLADHLDKLNARIVDLESENADMAKRLAAGPSASSGNAGDYAQGWNDCLENVQAQLARRNIGQDPNGNPVYHPILVSELEGMKR